MADVVIYTSGLCGFCYRAKKLLKQKGVDFTEVDVTFNRAARAEMARKAGGNTSVPQIWIGDLHVGGSDELDDLEAAGRLDELLAGAA